jgi:Holliday junction resolvase RusA-like endonuclease
MESVEQNGVRWFALAINPEPWTVGPLNVGRKNGGLYPYMGAAQQLVAYQEAIREEFGEGHQKISGDIIVRFYFWRQQATYSTEAGRKHRKHRVDATNMQKALEDALQGILYDNDRDVQVIGSVIVEQGPDVKPKIVISIEQGPRVLTIPTDVWRMVERIDNPVIKVTDADLPYRDAGGLF